MDIINTIFYFPDSLTFEDYSEKLSRGEISERTIVFASEQKSVYKNGKKYGGLSLQEFRDLIDTLYGDSWISDELNGVKGDVSGVITRADQFNTLLSALKDRLDDEIAERDANIQGKVESLMQDAQWLQQNFPQGVTQWDERWDSDLEAYLRTVGYWTTDGNQTVTQWSKLQQSINSVESSVNSLKQEGNLTTALTSSIEQLIQNDIASLSLGTTYAKVSDVDDTKRVIEWLYSGLQTSASAEKTFAQLQSMAKNEFTSAISEIRTQVEKVKNGDFVATADMTTKVGDSIAALLQQASGQNALATLAARLDTADSNNNDRINAALIGLGVDKNIATADISTSIGNVMSGFTSSADVTNRINTATAGIYSAIGAKDGNGNFISLAALKTYAEENRSAISAITNAGDNTAGFITESTLGSAVAQLFASSGDGQDSTAKANVIALVKDNKSSLNLSADDVNISGYLNAGNARFKGDVQANVFQTGNDSEYGICVTKSTFNESTANKRKAYFGYDSEQGGVTMWFYQGGQWKKLNLADSAVVNDPDDFREDTFYTISDTSITVLPKNLPSVKLYYNRAKDKYYTSAATTNPANGTYYSISQYNDLFTISSTARSNHPVDFGFYATVREIMADGTIVQSGLISEFGQVANAASITDNGIIFTTAYRFIIENGVVSHSDPFAIVQAVRDVYYASDGRIQKVIVAPVIVKAAPDTGMPETNSSRFPRIQYYSSNRKRNEYGSTHVITLDGRILEKTGSAVNTNTGAGIQCPLYIASTLSSALGANISQERVNVSSSYTSAQVQYQALNMVYPSTSGYTY